MRASLPREGQSAPSCKRAPNVGHVQNNKMPAKGPPSPGRQTWSHSMRISSQDTNLDSLTSSRFFVSRTKASIGKEIDMR